MVKTKSSRESTPIPRRYRLYIDNVKFILGSAAHRAYPIRRKIRESRPRLCAAGGIALGRIVNITAKVAYILLHFSPLNEVYPNYALLQRILQGILSAYFLQRQAREQPVARLTERPVDAILGEPYQERKVSEYTSENYTRDAIKAVDAKFEAQKIAFAPLAFQAVRALLELGLLKAVSDSGEKGIGLGKAAEVAGVSLYGAKVLLEIALGMNIVKAAPGTGEDRFVLGKTGWFLLEDEMTRVNFDFVNDVCYKGAFELTRSVQAGKPLGLEAFGSPGKTIYEALSSLPEKARASWFAFDHFYSDIGFEEALPLVFFRNPKKIIDIGGNTARWALRCCRHDPHVQVTIIDLPGQIAAAEQAIARAGFSGRIKTLARDILDKETAVPTGADIIWMSQFLDCFSLEDVGRIMEKVRRAAGPVTDIYILEPFWDKQRFEAASYSLQAVSLYFTCMANGNSKMYRYEELAGAIEKAGFDIAEARHNLGSNDYSLLRCRGRP
jgi:hypothetical protein